MNKSITIQEAQEHYSLMPVNNKAVRQAENSIEFKSLERTPNWKGAIKKVLEGQEIVIVPIRHNKYRALRYSKNERSDAKGLDKDDSQLGLDETSFLYFYKSEKGEIIYEVVTSVPTESWAKNPTKRFSGYTIVSDNEMNFKRGIVFKNGEVTGGFGISNADKRARGEICGWVEQWGYNYTIDGNGAIISGPFYVNYGNIPIYCTLAPDISSGYQLPTNSYDGTGVYYNPPAQVSEAEYFATNFVVDPGSNPVNVQNHLRCFSNSSNNTYKVTVSVDQPISGSNAPFNLFTSHRVGHTYITLTQIKPSGETIQRTIGYYPQYAGHPLNPNVPSEFHNDSYYSGGWDVQLSFQVTGTEMMQIINFIPNYNAVNYDLSYRNCGNFATDVLGQIGINVASHWMNTYWYSYNNNIYGGNTSEIRGPSVGALGEQLFNTPPNRTTSKSHAGGSAPSDLGTCN